MPRREQFVNNARTELSASMTAASTSATVADGSVFPATGDFRIIIGAELLLVTARASNVLTVVRSIENTAATIHNVSDSVAAILTASALEDYQKENSWSGNQSFPLRIYNLSTGAPGLVSDFTFINQGSATAVNRDGRIVLTTPKDVGQNVRALVQSAPTPPYEIVFAFSHVSRRENSMQSGACFRESATGELMTIARLCDDTLQVIKYDSPTALNSTLVTASWQFGNSVTWLKIEDDNTNLKFHVSPNGQDWLEFGTEGRTVFMAGGPNQVGFYGNPATANNNDMLTEVYAFGEV